MKQGQNARKGRARNTSRKNHKNQNAGNRSEVRVRGNPKQHLEKYKNQAREALQAGDRVTAEYYFQFADHYQRVLNSMSKDQPQRHQKKDESAEDTADRQDDTATANGGDEAAAEQQADNRRRPQRGRRPQRSRPEQKSQADLAGAEQPKEVHPELDLPFMANPAPVDEPAGEEEKPKRKRGRPKKAEASDAAVEAGPDGEAAA